MPELLLAVLGVLLFIGGFFTGLYIARHSYIEREVEKIVTTEKVVVHEKPTVIQVPTVQKRTEPASLPVFNSKRNVIEDPIEREASKHMVDLLGDHPEA